MKIVCMLTEDQLETLRDVQDKWECELELLRGELDRVNIKQYNQIEEIADRMESLNRVMENVLISQ